MNLVRPIKKMKGEFIEEKRLMLMMSGMLHTENWNQQDQEVDIYDVEKIRLAGI